MEEKIIVLYGELGNGPQVNVLIKDETMWLTQKQMAELFGVNTQAISKHLQNIFSEGELDRASTCSKMEQVQFEGERTVRRIVEFQNLDAIIAVGYRVNSSQATRFRIWATSVLKEYIIKGFALDDERLKQAKTTFGKDYFKELLERVRSIRASEQRIWLQVTEIFAECSIDYDPNSMVTRNFFAKIQNLFHFAITGKTAAEIVYHGADRNKPNMGLTTWPKAPDGRIQRRDTKIAKNYMAAEDIASLERAVNSYFDYIEGQIKRKKTFTMASLTESVIKFLDFNEFEILQGKGKVSQKQAQRKANEEYEVFNKQQVIGADFKKFLKEVKELEK